MSFPKYFSHRSVGSLYVITSKDIGFSIRDDKTRGSMNWTLAEMSRTNGFKPATVAQIRRFIPDYKPAPRKPAVKITPFPPQLTLPEGYVYLGKGREFKRPDDKSFRGDFAEVTDGRVTWHFGGEASVSGEHDNFYYIAKIGSPVALLNGHKVKTSALKTALSKLAALTEENLRLWAIIAASKKELEKA